jgi:hypothetical protein
MANLLAQVSNALGDERAQLLLGDALAGKARYSTWGATFGGLSLSNGELFTVCVNSGHPDGLEYGQFHNANGGTSVSENRHEVELYVLPEAVASRFFDPWLAQMGITNTTTRANP